MVDGSIPHPLLGVIKEPIKLTVENSLVTKVEGGKEAEILKKFGKKPTTPMYIILEKLASV